MMRNAMRARVVAVAAAAAAVLAALAQAAPNPQAAAAQKNAAKAALAAAESTLERYGKAETPETIKAAATTLAARKRAEAEECEKLAAAYEGGEAEAIKAANQARAAAADASTRAQSVLTARINEDARARSLDAVEKSKERAGEDLAKEVSGQIAALTAAVAAWKQVAEIAGSDAAWDDVLDAQTKAGNADLTVNLANKTYTYAQRSLLVVNQAKQADNPELAKAAETIKDLYAKALAAATQMTLSQQQMNDLERAAIKAAAQFQARRAEITAAGRK